MIDEVTMATGSKSIVKDWDDGETVFLDYEKLTDEEINNLSLGIFDIINIPHKSFDNIIPNYVCSFFYSPKSKTGYCAIFINKDRETYHNLKHITRKDF